MMEKSLNNNIRKPSTKISNPHKDLEMLRRKKKELEAQKEILAEGLPHLYKFKWYKWAKDFFDSMNPMNLISAANQISKSSTQIRKAIEWSGNPKLWPKLWKNEVRMMWYLYPSKELFGIEWNTKWAQFMPKNEFKNHDTYGWKEIKEKGDFIGLKFNSGMHLYFRTYAQQASTLQAGTLGAVFCDEELPAHLYPELSIRLAATEGYFHMVCTPTLNQTMWRLAFQAEGELEKWPGALKLQVSMFDCMEYIDGTPGAYNPEKIQKVIDSCSSPIEVERRVFGKFITEEGRMYHAYNTHKHLISPYEIPKRWEKYVGIDIGSGGDAHPPAIVFIAVREDYKLGIVYKGWLGDDGSNYTSGDIYNRYLEVKGSDNIVDKRYDHAAKDFKTISDRAGDSFLSADKAHDRGEEILNTLFKHSMLFIFDSIEGQKLDQQLMTLMKDTPKTKAVDDYADAMRYAAVTIPWDFSHILEEQPESRVRKERVYTDEEWVIKEMDERRAMMVDEGSELKDEWSLINEEIAEWNSLY